MMIESVTKPTILIADDIPMNIKILGDALKADYSIRFATDGLKALEIARSFPLPDLILLDIMMPGMDGYDVCRTLKEDKETQSIPIIFITAMSQEEDETKGLELGAVDYITKPFSLPIVKARIKTHIELKRHRDMLERLSLLDGLTGIPNRRRFDECFDIEWKRAERLSSFLSVIMIDIDLFKQFNDFYGHQHGDDCLKLVAKTLAGSVKRASDCVARYGGEEFVGILPDTDIQGAIQVGDAMRQNVEALRMPHERSTVTDYVTISLGTATTIPTRGQSRFSLLEVADKNLYHAKADGRNCVKSTDISLGVTI
ncbi:response regulator receiver modulated diguanylate cyclase [Candidatus Moduliflexus flocculans]|uniref:Response regulator receiver modulated diguanylate cyclase n=1 Tax=Candidatus Moduliflexus flocculans TaxID=1499966 RepID=A0A081BMN0_9BACT|nr:response regulator receiver modulated diguanylate cyclase [Candidatus Moduliflexus flocculans]